MVHTEVISHSEDFAALKEEWNLLLEKDPLSDFFLSHEWLYSWWETFGRGRELFIILCRTERDGRIVGIFPAFVEKSGGVHSRRSVRLLGSEYVSSDFLGILVDPAVRSDVLDALLDFLHGRDFSWDLLDLDDLDSKGHLTVLMGRLVFGDGSKNRLLAFPGEICPFLILPEDRDAFLRGLSGKMRSNLRYSRKALERSGSVEIEKVESLENIEEALGEVMRLRRSWIEARGFTPPCPFALYAEFHRQLWTRLLPTGKVHIRFLRFEGRRIAFAYLLRHAKSVYFYQTAFDQEFARRSVGSVLLSQVIEEAISWGCTRFEFLRGDENYKYKWGEIEQRRLVRMKVYNATSAGRLSYGVDMALKNTRKMVSGMRGKAKAGVGS